MKGEIINCSAHKDIYFLETNTKNEVKLLLLYCWGCSFICCLIVK